MLSDLELMSAGNLTGTCVVRFIPIMHVYEKARDIWIQFGITHYQQLARKKVRHYTAQSWI